MHQHSHAVHGKEHYTIRTALAQRRKKNACHAASSPQYQSQPVSLSASRGVRVIFPSLSSLVLTLLVFSPFSHTDTHPPYDDDRSNGRHLCQASSALSPSHIHPATNLHSSAFTSMVLSSSFPAQPPSPSINQKQAPHQQTVSTGVTQCE